MTKFFTPMNSLLSLLAVPDVVAGIVIPGVAAATVAVAAGGVEGDDDAQSVRPASADAAPPTRDHGNDPVVDDDAVGVVAGGGACV